MPWTRPRRCRPAVIVILLGILLAMSGSTLAGGVGKSGFGPTARDHEPVLFAGSMLPDLLGRPISDLRVMAWDPTAQDFVPVPFQIDERVNRLFNPGTEAEFTELIYDVLGEDDGLLDGDDEFAVLYGDAGGRARDPAAWPEGAEGTRYEVEILDPRPSTSESRWVYVYAGSELPTSNVEYVTWDGGLLSTIRTDVYELGYEGRWLLTEYRVLAPCGAGVDLIDRVKGRANQLPGAWEDEEGWDVNSSYLGGISGPVRAIRYVRGASSGLNTIHHDIAYRRFWKRRVNLRVHPIQAAWLYVDWRPPVNGMIFTPLARSGVPADGNPDGLSKTMVDWALFRSDDGGLLMLFDLPPTPLITGREFFYQDDSSYDDAIPANPGYPDEDNSAYGNVGWKVIGVADTNVQAATMTHFAFPLCGGEGDASLADAWQEARENAFQVSAEAGSQELRALRSLRLSKDAADVILAWARDSAADGYRVYVSETADAAPETWTLLAEVTELSYRDVGAASLPEPRHYTVVSFNAQGEGPR